MGSINEAYFFGGAGLVLAWYSLGLFFGWIFDLYRKS